MATDPTVRISVNRQRREFATQDIGVRGADMGVANSLASIAQSQANMANTAFQRAGEQSERDAEKDLRKLAQSDIVRNDADGSYQSTVPAILGKLGKNRGSVYNDRLRAGAYKKFNDAFSLEFQAKSSEMMRKYPNNSIMYQKAMDDNFGTVTKNFSDEEKGTLSLLYNNIVTSGVDVVKKNALMMRLKEQETLIKLSKVQQSEAIVSKIALNLDTFNFDEIGKNIDKVLSEINPNFTQERMELGEGTHFADSDKLTDTQNKIASVNQLIKSVVAGIANGDNAGSVRNVLSKAIANKDVSIIDEKAVTVIAGKKHNLRDIAKQIIEIGAETGATDSFAEQATVSDRREDALNAEQYAEQKATEELTNSAQFEDNANELEEIASRVNAMSLDVNRKVGDFISGQDSAFNKINLSEMVSQYNTISQRMGEMVTSKVGTTRQDQMTTGQANTHTKTMTSAISRVIAQSLSKTSPAQKSAVAYMIRNGGQTTEWINKNNLVESLPANLKKLLRGNQLGKMSADTREALVRSIVSDRVLQESAGVKALQVSSTIASAISGNGNLNDHDKDDVEAVLLNSTEHTFTAADRNNLKDGKFFRSYNRNVSGNNEFYNEALRLAREHNYLVPSLKEEMEEVFAGGPNVTSAHVYNMMNVIKTMQIYNSDLTVHNPLRVVDGMKSVADKFAVINSLMKTQSPTNRDIKNYLNVLNEIDQNPEALNLAYTRYEKEDGKIKLTGRQNLTKIIRKEYSSSPTFQIMTKRIMDYHVMLANEGTEETFRSFIDEIDNDFFVSSEGTIPVISMYDKHNFTTDGTTRSFMSLNRMLSPNEVKAFNVFAELDDELGLQALTDGKYSFFGEGGTVEFGSAEDIPDTLRGPILDQTTIIDPTKQFSGTRGAEGIKKAILIAHPRSSTDIGKLVNGEYTNDVLYFAYTVGDDGRLAPVPRADGKGNVIFDLKQFKNLVEKGKQSLETEDNK